MMAAMKSVPCIVWMLLSSTTESFAPKSRAGTSPIVALQQPTTLRTAGPLYFFGNNKNKEKDDDKDDSNSNGEPKKEKERMLPFFGRMMSPKEPAVATTQEEKTLPPAPTAPKPKEIEGPAELAKRLRAQAERARLEAERMDAELTLEKIEKLERQLVKAKTKGDSVEDLQRQLENMQAKLRGEAPKPPVSAPSKSGVETSELSEPNVRATIQKIQAQDLVPKSTVSKASAPLSSGFISEDFDEVLSTVKVAPDFMKKLIASMVDVDYDTVNDINATEVATRLVSMSNADYSFSNMPMPTFTQAQIDETVKQIEQNSPNLDYPERFAKLAGTNTTKLAEYALGFEYYMSSKMGKKEDTFALIQKVGEGEEWMQGFMDAVNQTAVDRSIETLYPKCMRKEDAKEPTMVQVHSLAANVLPQAKFSSSSKPEKVLGGYVLRGTHKYENGDDLIAAIDRELAKTSLGDKMTVLYTGDFTVFAQAEEDDFDLDLFDPDALPPILYITGPDIVRDRMPVALSITTAFGLATSWYLSIYPFLLNPTLAKRIEDQLALADASMQYDLDWLTELSVPLFVSFLGIQLIHEAAHRLVASAYDMEVSVPTLVPSLVTGVTSTVTSFKAPPKNKEAMFDFSVSGPLAGTVASVAALVVGSQLTMTTDPAFLPALPLEILRQSTLGGGIIDSVMPGTLYVPDGAPMSGIMISLHPLAIAGYISLIVNALALLPVGTTDGGRIGQALFGRPAKLIVGNLFLSALFLVGVLGSDLFLFYFSYVIAVQTGNEVPARNEVDTISFSRVLVAIVGYCLAFLTLVPFQ